VCGDGIVPTQEFDDEKPTYHSQSMLRAQHPHCPPELFGKSSSAVGTTLRSIQRGEGLPQTAPLGTVPLLELSLVVLLRVDLAANAA
jgi:hypothetical protein